MNLREIRDELIAVIQDPSYSAAELDSYINATYQHVFSLVNVPSLKGIGQVDTNVGANYVSLNEACDSGEFRSRISRMLSDDITLYGTLDLLYDAYGEDNWDAAGSVEAVAQEGTVLWYQPIPATAETISFIYYKNPPAFTDEDSEPTYIPDQIMQRLLLVNGTAWRIFEAIEDADDTKVAAKSHFFLSFDEDNKYSGINKYRAFVSRYKPHHLIRVWDY